MSNKEQEERLNTIEKKHSIGMQIIGWMFGTGFTITIWILGNLWTIAKDSKATIDKWNYTSTAFPYHESNDSAEHKKQAVLNIIYDKKCLDSPITQKERNILMDDENKFIVTSE